MAPARLSNAQYARLRCAGKKKPAPAKPRAPQRREEAATLRAILGWLRFNEVEHWRANSGGGMRPGRGGRMVPVVGNPSGTPDVLAVLPYRVPGRIRPIGRLVGIEVKSPGGRLSPAQIDWRDRMRRAGALYLEVRSLGELIDALREEGFA